MEKLRRLAIHRLSTNFLLPAQEKFVLGRTHRVGKWVDEGVRGLLQLSPLALEHMASLGWETAARLLWIKVNATSNGEPAPPPYRPESPNGNQKIDFGVGLVRCPSCFNSFFGGSINPSSCCKYPVARLMAERKDICSGIPVYLIQWHRLLCGLCGRQIVKAVQSSCMCKSCGMTYGHSEELVLAFAKSVEALIEEAFGEEMKEYKINEVL